MVVLWGEPLGSLQLGFPFGSLETGHTILQVSGKDAPYITWANEFGEFAFGCKQKCRESHISEAGWDQSPGYYRADRSDSRSSRGPGALGQMVVPVCCVCVWVRFGMYG